MEVYETQSVKLGEQAFSEKDKQRWAEEYALRMVRLFEQWQKPLGIDSEEYLRHLKKELLAYCDKPLCKSLIESISRQ
ncbi:MAG: hypothetical protein ACYTBJ_13240 [Planctomycetota bacterium]